MLTLKCYWYDIEHHIDPKQTCTYTSDCVGELIQQAFLKKLSVRDWVGYQICDEQHREIHSDFTDSAVLKKLWGTSK